MKCLAVSESCYDLVHDQHDQETEQDASAEDSVDVMTNDSMVMVVIMSVIARARGGVRCVAVTTSTAAVATP